MRNPALANMFERIDDAELVIVAACVASSTEPASARIFAQHAIERVKQIFVDAFDLQRNRADD